MFKYLYGTTRQRNYSAPISLTSNISMNGGYTTEFFNKGQFQDYEEAGIVSLSMPIPNERFTSVIPKIDENESIIGTIPKLTRFVMLKYSDVYTNAIDLQSSVEKSSSDTAVQMFSSPADALSWVKANTDLVEISPWVFEISAERIGIMGEVVPQKVLTIA